MQARAPPCLREVHQLFNRCRLSIAMRRAHLVRLPARAGHSNPLQAWSRGPTKRVRVAGR